jgi:hypothetical protein
VAATGKTPLDVMLANMRFMDRMAEELFARFSESRSCRRLSRGKCYRPSPCHREGP